MGNGMPYRYLRFLFTELPKAQSPEAIAALLPFNIAPRGSAPPLISPGGWFADHLR
jgi:hypothetical protein